MSGFAFFRLDHDVILNKMGLLLVAYTAAVCDSSSSAR